MAKGWQRRFDDPITLASGDQLATLLDAGNYIASLPKAEHDQEEWQTAIEALIMAAEGRWPLMHSRIGMLRALNRNTERVFNPDRKDRRWGSGSWREIGDLNTGRYEKSEAEQGRTSVRNRR